MVGHLYFQLLWRLRPENCLSSIARGCSELRSHHCTSGWETERDTVSKKNFFLTPNFLILQRAISASKSMIKGIINRYIDTLNYMGSIVKLKIIFGSGVATQACNPSTLGGQSRQIAGGQEFETSLTNMVKPCLYQK